MMMRRRSAIAYACLLATSALIVPVAALARAVVIGSEGANPPLDPHRMTGTPGLRVIGAIYDPLVREVLSTATDMACRRGSCSAVRF